MAVGEIGEETGGRGDWRGDVLVSMELQVRANVKKLGWMS
jgi:hypothetical protein